MMGKIYYNGNTPMLKYKSGNAPCAVSIDKIAADAIESLEARVKQLEDPALSPALPDEIKDMVMWLNTDGLPTALRIADMLERQEQENAKLDKMLSDIADESIGRLETIGELEQRIKKLQTQLANITALCSQEGNDGEPWGTIYALAERNK